MVQMDDQWIRLFNVSDPRRAYAGHTLYKVTSKVFQKDFPEGATEISVWRRFSDFKKLHRELLKIYIQKHAQDKFPPFPKAAFFGRFDDAVIEDRRKASLELLTFAGGIPDLFTSQTFIKFFEGAFPDNQAHNDSVASRESSLSDTEGDIFKDSSSTKESVDISCSGNTVQNSPWNNSEESSILGGVWLCKQPSLSEGLDILSSDEEEIDGLTPDDDASNGTPQALTERSNNKADQNVEDEQDEVFTHDTSESLEKEIADISHKQDRSSSTEPPQWLVRAISICSEGEDLEVLASEATEEELSFPQAFSDYSYCEEKEQSTVDDSITQEDEDQCTSSLNGPHQLEVTLDTSKSLEQGSKANNSESVVCETGINCKTEMIPGSTSHSNNDVLPESSDSSWSPKDSNSAGTVNYRQSFTSVKRDAGNKKVVRQRTVSDLTNICIDPKESDYLYAAGHTIHKALDCEVSGNYEEAFSLYKTCVGLLLSGVQGEKDVKRREAVRRKTAQYLLKAEALYSTYLAGNDSSEKSEDSSLSQAGDLCQSDDLQKFKDLILADLKVMGIVGKVMLVENKNTGETFVVKALCKSGQTKPNNVPQGSLHKRKKSVRRLYGKYPNIVQLYRYFETATSIYLLLEYARGGRLWDHLSCYQHNKESQDNLIRSVNRKFTNLKKSADVEHVTLDKENAAPLFQNKVTHPDREVTLSDKKNDNYGTSNERNSSPLQDSKHSSEVTQKAVEQLDATGNGNDHHISVPQSCNNEELLTENRDPRESIDTHDKQSLFVKLDEYFTSSTQSVPDEHKRIWAAELVLAVAYLHAAGIICRDLHPKNVLLDEEGHILLTYFGSWEETDHIPDKTAMNHFYCAPEIWQVDDITPAADWWSVGALLYEIITGQALSIAHPWGIKTHTELHLQNKISPEAKSLLRELLRVTPSERLGSGVNGVEEIKSHPYFSGVNWAWLCSRIN